MSSELEVLAELPYRPSDPKAYRPGIGLIGCGGISKHHLIAYLGAGYDVRALCDLNLEKAERRRAEYFPDASICSDYRELLTSDEIEIIDIVTHPPGRPAIIESALLAGKHVLSQKPFVLDLDVGERLVELADKQDRVLAVNQNGRWAPHFSYARLAAKSGVIGDVFGAHLGCYWDHTWVRGTEFENVKHLILYDYAIHWFDILRCFLPGRATRVFASTCRAPGQSLRPDLLGQAAVEFEDGQATLAFDAALPHGSHDCTFLSGTRGCLHSYGVDIQQQEIQVTTAQGRFSPHLVGSWFSDGFHGTMGELLCAIEDQRECAISAADNLRSLALCFAAIQSAESGESVKPGSIRRMPT